MVRPRNGTVVLKGLIALLGLEKGGNKDGKKKVTIGSPSYNGWRRGVVRHGHITGGRIPPFEFKRGLTLPGFSWGFSVWQPTLSAVFLRVEFLTHCSRREKNEP